MTETYEIKKSANIKKILIAVVTTALLICAGISIYLYFNQKKDAGVSGKKPGSKPTANDNPKLFDFTKKLERKLEKNKTDVLKNYEIYTDRTMNELTSQNNGRDISDIHGFNILLCNFHLSKVKQYDNMLFDELMAKNTDAIIEFYPFLFPTNTLYDDNLVLKTRARTTFNYFYTFDYVIQILKRKMIEHLPLSLEKLEAFINKDMNNMLKDPKTQFIIKTAIESTASFGLAETCKEFAEKMLNLSKKAGINKNVRDLWKQAQKTPEVINDVDILKENQSNQSSD